jgi:hypothetical protein
MSIRKEFARRGLDAVGAADARHSAPVATSSQGGLSPSEYNAAVEAMLRGRAAARCALHRLIESQEGAMPQQIIDFNACYAPLATQEEGVSTDKCEEGT